MQTTRDQAIDVLVELLGEYHGAIPAPEFYDSLCAAVCRLTRLRRAALLLYDDAYKAVRAVGSHGVEEEILGHLVGNLNETPVAQEALSTDDVIVFTDFAEHVPERFRSVVRTEAIACIPVATGGRWLGVIFADRGGGRFKPTRDERQTILTLGRLAALAASVERATRQDERTRQLNERIELTREIHERVMQRLFGLTLALGSGQPLTAEERRTCHDELRSVLADLRSALGRPISSQDRSPRTTLAELVGRRAERTPQLAVSWPERLEVPAHLEALAQSVFLEALRNCQKHARPQRIEVRVGTAADAFELDIINDGTTDGRPGSGLGLRLLTMEALQQDALVEFGALPGGRWHVRMVGAVES